VALIDTVPTSKVTVPTFLAGYKNGELPIEILRCPDLDRTSTSAVWRMFAPVSWAMTAMQIAAKADGHILDTTGRYRSAERQEALFRERYKPGENNNDGCGSKLWNGVRWYLQRSDKGGCMAMAATPGTSNHGLGLADDLAEDPDQFDGTGVVFLGDPALIWLRRNGPSFGFGLETHRERWHWHWTGGDALTQRAADTLRAAGLTIPDLSEYGFTVPPPPDTGDDEVTQDEINAIADRVYVRMTEPAEDGKTIAEGIWQTPIKVPDGKGGTLSANIFSVIGWSYSLLLRIVKKLDA
jgi:hypothetical protein